MQTKYSIVHAKITYVCFSIIIFTVREINANVIMCTYIGLHFGDANVAVSCADNTLVVYPPGYGTMEVKSMIGYTMQIIRK